LPPERFTMKSVTIYREDMNNKLHGNLFDSLLDDLGIETHTIVAGRPIDREIGEVTIWVSGSTIPEDFDNE
jgi:hypothetical protein